MAEGKVSLEAGEFHWDTGQYQGMRDLPPGWFTAPHEVGRMPADSPMPPPRPLPPPPANAAPETPRPVRPNPVQTVRTPSAEIPLEGVSLTYKKAFFMGHNIELSDDSVESIRMILAMEIEEALERERARIYAAVHQSDLQAPSSDGGKDVPAVQESEVPVVEEPPGAVRAL